VTAGSSHQPAASERARRSASSAARPRSALSLAGSQPPRRPACAPRSIGPWAALTPDAHDRSELAWPHQAALDLL